MGDEASGIDGKPLLLTGFTIVSIPFSLGPRKKLGTETPSAVGGLWGGQRKWEP